MIGSTRTLAVVSAAQLELGLAGLRRAFADGTTFDVGPLHGSPQTMARDHWVTGTNLSAPGIMLVLQATCTGLLFTRHRATAARVLGVQGAIMSLGYAAETSIRQAWRQWTMPVAPLTAAATGLAMAMAVLGLREARRLKVRSFAP